MALDVDASLLRLPEIQLGINRALQVSFFFSATCRNAARLDGRHQLFRLFVLSLFVDALIFVFLLFLLLRLFASLHKVQQDADADLLCLHFGLQFFVQATTFLARPSWQESLSQLRSLCHS